MTTAEEILHYLENPKEAKEKTQVVQILEGLNVPHNNSVIMLDAHDIELTFNLDEELTIKELQVTDSLQKVSGEVLTTSIENGCSKVAMFIVVADLSVAEIDKFIRRIGEQDLYVIFGVYEPNEGEPNRVVAIMQ